MAIARAQTDPSPQWTSPYRRLYGRCSHQHTSLIGSPLIKNAKKAAGPDPARALATLAAMGRRPDEVDVEGQVVKNTSIQAASFADLFMGEYVETFALLDVAKIQMFFFTVLLVLAYAISVGRTLRADPSLAALPDVGSGMLPLLGISHAGYLLSKTVTVTRP